MSSAEASSLNIISIGKLGAPHGVRGAVRLFSYTDPAESIVKLEDFYIKTGVKGAKWEPLEVKNINTHGSNFIITIDGVDDRDKAASLTHSELGIIRESLPELESDEYYWADLIGLDVYNKESKHLGTVDGFMETGANDVLVVKGGKEHLIPYIPDLYILEVDFEQNRLVVDWSEEF